MTTTTPGSSALRDALDALLDGLPPRRAAAAVERLIAGYRGGGPAPALRDRADAVAYAAYRMPATHAAVAGALTRLAERRPGWRPAVHVDAGAGTGAAAWAAAQAWPGERRTLLLDRARPALELGRELAAHAPGPALRAAEWRRETLGAAGAELPPADLVTACYVLGELDEARREALTGAAAGAVRPGGAVVLVEPGTPDGYLRVRAARDRLTAAGLRVLAPCPHSERCPIEPGADWCHFAVRVGRSALHRRVKGGTLAYEDEKFSYVAAVRDPEPESALPSPARVVRHPQIRKGQVLLDLCTPEGELRRVTVTKRQGADYRTARDTAWGDEWAAP